MMRVRCTKKARVGWSGYMEYGAPADAARLLNQSMDDVPIFKPLEAQIVCLICLAAVGRFTIVLLNAGKSSETSLICRE